MRLRGSYLAVVISFEIQDFLLVCVTVKSLVLSHTPIASAAIEAQDFKSIVILSPRCPFSTDSQKGCTAIAADGAQGGEEASDWETRGRWP